MQTTRAAEMATLADDDDAVHRRIESSVEGLAGGDNDVELQIVGFGSNQVAARFGGAFGFTGLTFNFIVTRNATLTQTLTVTDGTRPFVVSGCTPSPFYYTTC